MENDEAKKVKSFMKNLEANENIKDMQEERPMRVKFYSEIAFDLKAYYDAMIGQGFKHEEAMVFTLNFQNTFYQNNGQANNGQTSE